MSDKNGSGLRSLGLGGVFKSLTNSLKPASGRVPVVINAKVVGGASDLQKLLNQLQHNALPLRVSAAMEITKSLRIYSVSSIPEIWYLARDLCDLRLASSVREVAITLMIQCIKHDSPEASSRIMYFRDILTFCKITETNLDPEFNLFFEALRLLTDDGRDIHDFCIYSHDLNWFKLITKSFVSMKYLCDLKRTQNVSLDIILSFAQYLCNCFKFNFSILDETFTAFILQGVFHIASSSEEPSLKFALCELVRTIAIFAFIPADTYTTVVFFLCSMAPRSLKLLSISWEAMSKLFYVSPLYALDATMSIFHAPELARFRGSDMSLADLKGVPGYEYMLTALGALSMLENMLLLNVFNEDVESFDIQYESLYQGLVNCLQLNITILNTGALRIFDHMFSISEEEEDEEKMHLEQRFSILFPFYTWYASSNSIFLLLLKLRVNCSQDEIYWTAICCSIEERMVSTNLSVPLDQLVELYMLYPHLLTESLIDFVLKFHKDNGTCVTSSTAWEKSCKQILSAFYFGKQQAKHPPNVRINVLRFLKEEYNKSMILLSDDSMGLEFVLLILRQSLIGEDESVLHFFIHTVLYDFLLTCGFPSFKTVLKALMAFFDGFNDLETSKIDTILDSTGHFGSIKNQKSIESSAKVNAGNNLPIQKIAECIAQLLIELLPTDSFKTNEAYDCLIILLHCTIKKNVHKTLLVIIRVLIRLRATSEGFLYFGEPKDMNGLATTFKRNTLDETYTENLQQLWHFPENMEYLPRKFFNQPNEHVLSHVEERGVALMHPDAVFLDLSKWLDLVTLILGKIIHWEIYSFIMAHLCSQLFNLSLFWHLENHVLAIQEIICEQITLIFPPDLSFPLPGSDLNKSDLQIALVRTLSSLLGYHNLFQKQHEENMVKSLLFGLGSWQKSAVPCIHILTICCYEILETLKKYLIPILTKLQTGVTSVYASSSALEFLMALIHVPSLTSNFTTDEFRQVFAICFRYIEHSLDTKKRGFEEKEDIQRERYLTHGVDAEVNVRASTHTIELTPLFYQYLLVVSYAVITRWFLLVNLAERSLISSFIVRNIISCSGAKDIDHLDDMTVAYLDAITRFTYSNIPLKIVTKTNLPFRGSMCRWILGHAIVEINTDVNNGNSIIVLRRPCGLSAFDLSLNPNMISKNMRVQPGEALMLRSHLLLQLFKPLDQGNVSKPIALLDDAFTERAINAFDRIPVVSHHKAGIIYIGPGQNEETEILANTCGSLEYNQFLEGLGELIRLRTSESIYVGGLDKESGTDGEYAYFWSDELTHLIYHTTTLMPNLTSDKFFAMKKRHIGNNHVNVFFDESGLPFNFNVIKSQFNFLNIVITPHTVGQSHDMRRRRFYKVITYRRNGVPGIFSTTHFKLISLEQLPHLVRNLVIMSNRFSEVWHNLVNGTYTTNWQLRVKQLNTLREKTLETHKQILEEQSATAQANISSNTALSFLEQLQPHRANEKEKMQDANEYASGASGEKDLYSLLEFNSYT
ncbi:hypothetical protein METBIDRAFT_105146 [Metschnikowia bicuspidata var. bicuspidata NRRL YB-4993]|uniref:Rap-GAP domain-containing protein n=1 Tax=Metschnikowia bicuspidata var. bicuspidata NRRL YB-4993 TaxID=869754 RepID=A0A1A0HHD8_9ASCO|nr:hypothetical protein METBIDRAFT_105146 [Metschnikowia bicuspidata var. bicuspidata NRRL YB-4993]OBA23416.1 hypothetical protein METBIDRAFT_105146 [Metschnikowia bicuspidata var. bicuspidata NRRL YB-4993]